MLGLKLGIYLSSGILNPSDDVIEPDPGYVFVYTYDDNQVFDQNDNGDQVPETFANS
jgi:hypothetical protein